jgi:hypothetical protein
VTVRSVRCRSAKMNVTASSYVCFPTRVQVKDTRDEAGVVAFVTTPMTYMSAVGHVKSLDTPRLSDAAPGALNATVLPVTTVPSVRRGDVVPVIATGYRPNVNVTPVCATVEISETWTLRTSNPGQSAALSTMKDGGTLVPLPLAIAADCASPHQYVPAAIDAPMLPFV